MPGKIDSPLNRELNSVKWGKFKLKDIFNNIKQGKRLKKGDQIIGNIPFVMSGTNNNGVANYISNPIVIFPANALTIDIFGNTFYRNYAFGAGDDTGVYWNTEKTYSREHMLFFAIAIKRYLKGKYTFGYKLRSSQSLDFEIDLPIKESGEMDFDFMKRFVKEVESEQIADLERRKDTTIATYLNLCNLEDCNLTVIEENVIHNLKKQDWKSYNLKALFGEATRGKRLKSSDRILGDLPFVTAGEKNVGISDLIGNGVEIFKSNTTTIDMFGSAKYRNYNYGADDHVAVVHTENLPKLASIFVTTACHKAAHTGKYSYGLNFYAKDADALNVMLPTKDGKPDYSTMETIIGAIQKLVIKDVVASADRKIEATKAVVAGCA